MQANANPRVIPNNPVHLEEPKHNPGNPFDCHLFMSYESIVELCTSVPTTEDGRSVVGRVLAMGWGL